MNGRINERLQYISFGAAAMRVKVPILPFESNNSASAIKAIFTTMPAVDQAALLTEQIAEQPVEVLEGLAARHFTRSALRRRRLDARDEDFRELARQIVADGGPVGDTALAREVRRHVERYEATAWPRERDGAEPADPSRAMLWRIPKANAGNKVPQAPQVVRILTGFRTP